MTSTDGFCSMVSFDENEIGVPLSPSELVDLLPSLQAPIEDKDVRFFPVLISMICSDAQTNL